jgi:stage III sporulation protein AG
MDIKATLGKLPGWIGKYRYPILVLAIGLVLMVLPGRKKQVDQPVIEKTTAEQSISLSAELTHILGKIQGVGKVEVMLTVKAGETTFYQSDEDISTTETGSTVRKETVIVTDANRQQTPLVTQILSPEYLGAVIVCQGANDVQVRLAVVEAVSKATGLSTDKITVLKMK